MDRKVFYNGTILTMQAEGHTVEAVYTIGDRIAAIGNRDDVFRQITDDTERVDLEGKTLIPGFIESHAPSPTGRNANFSSSPATISRTSPSFRT